ncbi:uncharacterized protein [Haliotis asinina]|uniref:uncharacterized protein n=1 Tax=Haliotis asinina TaxID=109174 RepID=UPI003531D7E8
MSLSVPNRKIDKLISTIRHVQSLSSSLVPVRSVASVVGQIISMKLVLGGLAQLMTRSLSMDIVTARSWRSKIRLTDCSKHQLQFWLDNIWRYVSRRLIQSAGMRKLVYSDASDMGYGGYCVDVNKVVSHGQWSEEERGFSSTWRELQAVNMVLNSLASGLRHERVKWFTDNQNVVNIVERGSMKSNLQSIALQVFNICFDNNIDLQIQWIPRNENKEADFLSRLEDHDDWGISEGVFQSIDKKWGPHQVDRCASYYNAKLTTFNSRYSNPGCSAVDCFTVSWRGVMNWVVPPVCLIPRVIGYMAECKAVGTLVVPEWKSSNFWPILCSQSQYIPQVKDCIYLPRSREAYVASRIRGGLFGEHDLTGVFHDVYEDEIGCLPSHVRDLAYGLPDLISHARADSTTKKYSMAYAAWKRDVFPVG